MKLFSTTNANSKINSDHCTKKKSFLAKNGYIEANKLCETLQGSIWLAHSESTRQDVAIKIANRDLVSKSTAILKGKEIKINEDIQSEALLLKFVSSDPKCPDSITKYVNFFKRYNVPRQRNSRDTIINNLSSNIQPQFLLPSNGGWR